MGHGQDFVGLDLARAVIAGDAWTGMKVARPGGVLWIAAEKPEEIPVRKLGLKLKRPYPFAHIESCPPLLVNGKPNQKALHILVQTAKAARQGFEQNYEVPLSLIQIDTLSAAACFPSNGENDPSTCQLVMNMLAYLGREAGAFVQVVDHVGKDISRGTRGGSSKDAGAVSVLSTAHRGSNANRLIVSKLSCGPTGVAIPYKLQVLTVGRDDNRDPITTCSVRWGEPAAESKAEEKKPSKAESILKAAIDDVGGLPVQLDELRDAFFAKYEGGPDAKRVAFNRLCKELHTVTRDRVHLGRRGRRDYDPEHPNAPEHCSSLFSRADRTNRTPP